MKKVILFFSLLLCATALFANPVINNVIFFGDSLTDNGNLYRTSLHIIPKSPPYYNGSFTNGPTWADDLANDLQQKFGIAHDNYAVGGATTIYRDAIKYKILPYDLAEEIGAYHNNTLGSDRSHVLYIIWIGANDYTSVFDQTPDELTTAVVNQIATDIATLKSYGAKNFLIFDLPDLAKTPRGVTSTPDMVQRYKELGQLHHVKLNKLVMQLQQQNPDEYFGFMDMYDLINDVLGNIDAYNQQYHLHIANITSPCWTGGYTATANQQTLAAEIAHIPALRMIDPDKAATSMLHNSDLQIAYQVAHWQTVGDGTQCADPDSFAFWDEVHPTRVTHGVLANLVEKYLLQAGLSFQKG